MTFVWISEKLSAFYAFLQKFSNSKFWILKTAVFCTIINIFFAAPPYPLLFKKNVEFDNQRFVKIVLNSQIQDPFAKITFSGPHFGSHMKKMQFRVLMPIIGHVFNLSVIGLILIQQLLGIVFSFLLILIVLKCTDDRVAALLTALGFSFIYAGSSFFYDLTPWFDGVALFCLACAMLSRNPFLIFLSLFAGSWVDERGLIAIGLVFIWHQILSAKGDYSLKKLLSPNWQSIAVILAGIGYFACRFLLMQKLGFKSDNADAGLGVIAKMAPGWIFGILTGLEWFWIVIIIGFLALIKDKNYSLILFLLACIGVQMLVSIMVFDNSRSTSYIFPAVFIALYLLYKKGEPILYMRYLLTSVVILCFMLPNFCILGKVKFVIEPFLGMLVHFKDIM